MKFWKLETEFFCTHAQALVCAATKEAARTAAIAQEACGLGDIWEDATITEVAPQAGMVLLDAQWE